MPRFTINQFKNQSDYRDRGIAGSFKKSKNLDVRGESNILTCNQALKDESTGAVVDLILWFVNCTDGNTYGFGNTGKIYKRTSAGVWSLVYTNADGRITGACEWYSIDGKKYLYFSDYTKLHRKEIPGNTGWSDVDTTLTSVAATSTLTVSGVPNNGATLTLGSVTYTYRTTLSSPTIANEIKIGASAEATIDNTVLAVTLGAGIGTNYSTGTVKHPTVTAVKATAATMTVTAIASGNEGNYIYVACTGNYLSLSGIRLTGGVSYSTWPKINLTSEDWHTMAVADGALQICNDDKLAFVGYDDSYTNEAVKFLPGATAKTLIEYGGRNVITGTGNDVDESYLMTWNTSALSWIDKLEIPFAKINAMINAEVLLMHVGDNKLYFANMTDKLPVLDMDGMVNPGGVCSQNGLALFGVWGGTYSGIYSYGRTKKNENYTYNLEYYLDADEIGAITNLGSNLLISYKKGTDYKVATIDTANKADGEYISLDLKSPYGRSQMANWQTIELITDTIPTGCSIECYYKLKDDIAWVQANISDGITACITGSSPLFKCGILGKVFEFKIVLNSNGNTCPVIHEIYVNL